MAARRKRPPPRTRPPSRSRATTLEALLAVIERNSQRISRLEDVFAVNPELRDEVAGLLKDVRAAIKRPRRR